jgi:hypothetical protein
MSTDILQRLKNLAEVKRHFENPIYADAAEEIDDLRKRLDRINWLACYASEEDVNSAETVLLEIGKIARKEVTDWKPPT